MAWLRVAVLLALLGLAAAECPNACSGHGDCTSFDKCVCYRNWQAADCSERTCPFGMAHVDSPKGDLNGDFELNDIHTDVEVVDVYHNYATTEVFPRMTDSLGKTLKNTAHEYAECSNKGLCDRASGQCKCLTGYEGHACQRASCPNDCSGHGTCHTIEHIAWKDHENVYKLWDREATMGCLCDAGYIGADCSLRQCKYGIDPLYTNLATTANMASWKVRIQPPDSGDETNIRGTYAIKFYDAFGEDYITGPIVHQDTDYCTDVASALESLPNSVIPLGSVRCNFTTYEDDIGYTITFTQNPGKLKPIEVDTYLDGQRATLYSTVDTTSKSGSSVTPITVHVTSAGAPGEFEDYFTNFCEGVVANVVNNPLYSSSAYDDGDNQYYVAKLTVGSDYEARLLKRCLADADGNWENNLDVENWDYGSFSGDRIGTAYADYAGPGGGTVANMVGRYPHAIKLVKKDRADIYDSGHVYLAWYSNSTTGFALNLLSRTPLEEDPDFGLDVDYYVFTTDGIAEQLLWDTNEDGDYTDLEDGPVVAWWYKYTNVIYTNLDASCENAVASTGSKTKVSNCLSKGDLIFLPAGGFGNQRSSDQGFPGDILTGRIPYKNLTEYTGVMYQVTKIWTEPIGPLTHAREDRYRIQLDKNINWDGGQLDTPWGENFGNTAGQRRTGYQRIFKFTPNTSYEYVAECANRGICDRTSAVCDCFKGYTNDNCDTQSALAV